MGLIVYDGGGDDNDCCDDHGEGDVTDAYDDNENYCDYDYGNDDEDMMMLMSTNIDCCDNYEGDINDCCDDGGDYMFCLMMTMVIMIMMIVVTMIW